MEELSTQDIELFSLSAYSYVLPQELIAKHPMDRRDESRLMVVEKKTGSIRLTTFKEILHYFHPGDLVLLNDTKVIPARLFGKRKTGGAVEIFLDQERQEGIWEALAKPAKKLRIGEEIIFSSRFSCQVIEVLEDGNRLVQFFYENNFYEELEKHGEIPLPPYLNRKAIEIDRDRYQTVYAENKGAVAAPTAGLHFTNELFKKMENKGIKKASLTLHVGQGTFRSPLVEDIRNHVMHKEKVIIPEETAKMIQELESKKNRCICIGTTSCRALESSVSGDGKIKSGTKNTDVFIYPGYSFKKMDALVTNFHLPRSSLLMLVSAFGGYDLIQEAYAKAIENRFRFFSYGDAMLIF